MKSLIIRSYINGSMFNSDLISNEKSVFILFFECGITFFFAIIFALAVIFFTILFIDTFINTFIHKLIFFLGIKVEVLIVG